MLLKKSAIAACSYSNASLPTLQVVTSCSSHNPRYRPAVRFDAFRDIKRPRRYATVHDAPPRKPSNSQWPASEHPTPYQIFDRSKQAPYDKARYYELVKIYHPDRNVHVPGDDALTRAVRLERYKMVVAANEILSDPAKKRAYDLYGAGWRDTLDGPPLSKDADRAWRSRPGNPSMNATWEDWEYWYGQHPGHPHHDPHSPNQKGKQQPVYMPNGLFAALLCLFSIGGSIVQAKWGTTRSAHLATLRDEEHEALGREMRQQQLDQLELSRGARVDRFLQAREWHDEESGHNLSLDAEGKNDK